MKWDYHFIVMGWCTKCISDCQNKHLMLVLTVTSIFANFGNTTFLNFKFFISPIKKHLLSFIKIWTLMSISIDEMQCINGMHCKEFIVALVLMQLLFATVQPGNLERMILHAFQVTPYLEQGLV